MAHVLIVHSAFSLAFALFFSLYFALRVIPMLFCRLDFSPTAVQEMELLLSIHPYPIYLNLNAFKSPFFA